MDRQIKSRNRKLGRTPIERLILSMESYKLINVFTVLLLLFLFIGINSIIHEDLSNGFIFLVLVCLILLTGLKPAANFFDTSALAIFISIHLSLFGFNVTALTLVFLGFYLFKSFFEKNLLFPIIAYLITDSIVIFFDINNVIIKFSELYGSKIFSLDGLLFLLIIPIVYGYLKLERLYNEKFSDHSLVKNGLIAVIVFLLYIFIIIGIITDNLYFKILGGLLFTLYFIGMEHLHENSGKREIFFLFIPIPILIIVIYFVG